jgi:hypothetical protein
MTVSLRQSTAEADCDRFRIRGQSENDWHKHTRGALMAVERR